MIGRRALIQMLAGVAAGASSARALAAAKEQAYFPPAVGRDWDSLDPGANGWDRTALEEVFRYAQDQRSTGLILVQRGRILGERYWRVPVPDAFWRQTPKQKLASGHYELHYYYGETQEGWPVEDVASIQKSVTSVLTGIARRKGLVDIERSVSSYLMAGWSRAPREREAAITVRHLLSMNSGLDERLAFKTPPGTQWFYNTTAYGQLDNILERASGQKLQDITRDWFTGPIGMTDSRWEERQDGLTIGSNNIGFVTTPRDLARFGLLMINRGMWNGRDIIADPEWLSASLSPSPAPGGNPAYGYLWWLNNGAYSLGLDPRSGQVAGPLIPTAPTDLVAGIGHFMRRLYIVPSLSLVAVRLGPEGDVKTFDHEIWARIARAAPK